MPVNVKVIQTREFIRTTPTGAIDLKASTQALLDIASLIEEPAQYEVLLDTRQAEINLSNSEVYELGKTLAAHRPLYRSKIGLLTPMADEENARFFENVVHNRGVKIKAFTNFEEAITWLIMSEQGS